MDFLPDEYLHRYPKRDPGAETRGEGEEAEVVLPSRGLRFVLNETAARLWERFDGKTSLAAAVDALCEEYDADRAEADLDAVHLVRALEQGGFLSMLDEPE